MREIIMSKEYNVGDLVYWAKADIQHIRVKCPVCFGKRVVTLIMGNDEQVVLECDYCGKGCDNAPGYIDEWEWTPGVQEIKIDKKIVEEVNGERDIEYRYVNYILRHDDIFSTVGEAEERIKEKIVIHEQEEAERMERIKDVKNKSYAWLVGYHRRQAKEAQKDLEYHSGKVVSMGKLAKPAYKEDLY